MQIHASLSRAFLQGSFDICILNTTSKDTKLPRGKAARHTLCLEMDYGWQHHIGIQTWVSHTIPVWDFCLRTLLGYITHSLDDGEIFKPLHSLHKYIHILARQRFVSHALARMGCDMRTGTFQMHRVSTVQPLLRMLDEPQIWWQRPHHAHMQTCKTNN